MRIIHGERRYQNCSDNLINSEYFNETTFNNTFKINTYLSMFHLKLNIRSVSLQVLELLTYLDILEIEFKLLSETALIALMLMLIFQTIMLK